MEPGQPDVVMRYVCRTVSEAIQSAEVVRFQSEALRVNGDSFSHSLCQEALAAFDFMAERCRLLEARSALSDVLLGDDSAGLPVDTSDREVVGMLSAACRDVAQARGEFNNWSMDLISGKGSAGLGSEFGKGRGKNLNKKGGGKS